MYSLVPIVESSTGMIGILPDHESRVQPYKDVRRPNLNVLNHITPRSVPSYTVQQSFFSLFAEIAMGAIFQNLPDGLSEVDVIIAGGWYHPFLCLMSLER